jgi:sigma-54 specific flagellar transcriptional regulator A
MLPTSLLPKGLAALRESMFGDTGPRSLLHMLTSDPLTPAPQDPTPAQQAPALDNQTPTQAQATGDDANPLEALLGLAQGQPLAELPAGGLHLKETLADIEKSFISQALAMAEGNVSRTARLLSIQRTTLIEKINKYELRASD